MAGRGRGGGRQRGRREGARSADVPSRRVVLLVGFVFAGGSYLLLIDTTSLPELYTGAVVTLVAVLALVAAHAAGFAEASFAPRWFIRAWRPFARIPVDVATLSLLALAQLVRPAHRRGRFVAIPFANAVRGGDGDSGGREGAHEEERDRAHALNIGQRALVQALGCVSPNTIVLGVDTSRRLIIAHQLRPHVNSRALDPMDLG